MGPTIAARAVNYSTIRKVPQISGKSISYLDKLSNSARYDILSKLKGFVDKSHDMCDDLPSLSSLD